MKKEKHAFDGKDAANDLVKKTIEGRMSPLIRTNQT